MHYCDFGVFVALQRRKFHACFTCSLQVIALKTNFVLLGLDASATLSSMVIGHVVSLNDETAKAGVLAPNSEALFAKELSDLLVSLEVASRRYGSTPI
jgi:hypothetical protein